MRNEKKKLSKVVHLGFSGLGLILTIAGLRRTSLPNSGLSFFFGVDASVWDTLGGEMSILFGSAFAFAGLEGSRS
jgi:hypothetical protein